MKSNKRMIVTGGAGFIGSELVAQLCTSGAEIMVLDNLVNGRLENIEGLLSDKVKFIKCDIRDRTRMAELIKGVDIIFHLACLGVRHSLHSPEENHEVNAGATLALLLEARRANVKRFVYVSSSEVYGTAQSVPINETHPAFPMTVYGASKLAGECYARAFYRSYGFPCVIVRPFNSYGPRCHHEGDSGEVIPKFILRAMAGQALVIFGDGRQTRDFTYVSDTARGIFDAGFAADVVGETINLGSGEEIAIAALAQKIKIITRSKDVQIVYENDRPGDVLRLCADTKKSFRLLNFKPLVAFDDGLQRLMAWYQKGHLCPEVLLKEEVIHNWDPAKKTADV